MVRPARFRSGVPRAGMEVLGTGYWSASAQTTGTCVPFTCQARPGLPLWPGHLGSALNPIPGSGPLQGIPARGPPPGLRARSTCKRPLQRWDIGTDFSQYLLPTSPRSLPICLPTPASFPLLATFDVQAFTSRRNLILGTFHLRRQIAPIPHLHQCKPSRQARTQT